MEIHLGNNRWVPPLPSHALSLTKVLGLMHVLGQF